MTWIRTTPRDDAEAELRDRYDAIFALYPPEYRDEVEAVRNADGSTDSVTAAHSLIPAAMGHAMSAFAVLTAADLPLTRAQQEMIATVVSALNSCFY